MQAALGNVYILKQRDARNVVIAMYILDPQRVVPLVTDDGAVWYRLSSDRLAQLVDASLKIDGNTVAVPASEIIHDRMLTLWHPLVGVSPIYACGSSATQGIRIQNNSARFFENMSRPSGILTSPDKISDELAERYKRHWEANYTGGNIGKMAVLGNNLHYEAMTIPAHDAQLIEQLRWTVEDVARCFHVPLHKLGMGAPTLNNIASLNQDYYSQCLQALIECVEVLLDEGLALPADLGTELDLENLLRMDPLSVADFNEKGIRAGYLAPNEARLKQNLEPVDGGDTPYMQQQNFSLAALDRRDSQESPPPLTPTPTPAAPVLLPAPAPVVQDRSAELMSAIAKRFTDAMQAA